MEQLVSWIPRTILLLSGQNFYGSDQEIFLPQRWQHELHLFVCTALIRNIFHRFRWEEAICDSASSLSTPAVSDGLPSLSFEWVPNAEWPVVFTFDTTRISPFLRTALERKHLLTGSEERSLLSALYDQITAFKLYVYKYISSN